MFSPLEDAARLVPAWVPWAPLLYLPLIAVLSFCCARLNAWWMLRPLRKLDGAHWTERSRLAFPARMVAGWTVVLFTGVGANLGLLYNGSLSRVPAPLLLVLGGLAAWAPAYLVKLRLEKQVRTHPFSLQDRARSAAVVFLIFIPHWTLGFAAIWLAPHRFNAWMALFVPVVAVLMVLAFRGGGVAVARRLGLVRPVDAPLRELILRVEERMAVRARAVYMMPLAMANAAAVQVPQVLLYTPLMVREFSDAELEAITAHELAHLTESPAVVRTRMLGLVLCLVVACAVPIVGSFGWRIFLGAVVAAFGLLLYVRGVARRMEQRADATAGAQAEDPQAYARALEHLTELNGMPAVGHSRHAVHPHLYDRMLSVGVQPDYPRPAPPPRSGRFLPPFTFAALVVLVFALRVGVLVLGRSPRQAPAAFYLDLGWDIGGGSLETLAWEAWNAGDPDRAVTFYRASAAADTRRARPGASAAICLAGEERIEEARAELAEARRRIGAYPDRNGEDERQALQEAERALRIAAWKREKTPANPDEP